MPDQLQPPPLLTATRPEAAFGALQRTRVPRWRSTGSVRVVNRGDQQGALGSR